MDAVEAIVRRVVEKISSAAQDEGAARRRMPIRVEASARHAHLDADAAAKLFGKGAELGRVRELSQPGEFLSDRRVKVVTPKGELANVAVLGPLRDAVQVELSRTDCRALGLEAPVNVSGDLTGAGDAYLVGPAGMIEAKGSVIVARAHAHLRPQDARAYGLRDGETADVEVCGPGSARRVTFGGVAVRVNENFSPAVHIDLDEANACMLGSDSEAYIICGGMEAMRGEPVGEADVRPPAPRGSCCSCAEKVLTESMAKKIVASCECRKIQVGARTIITPSARDVFSAAKWTLERGA